MNHEDPCLDERYSSTRHIEGLRDWGGESVSYLSHAWVSIKDQQSLSNPKTSRYRVALPSYSPNPQESTSTLRRGRLLNALLFDIKFLHPFTNSANTSVGCCPELPSLSSVVSCTSLLFMGHTCLATGRSCGFACVVLVFGVVW